jgi:hypothetical protein
VYLDIEESDCKQWDSSVPKSWIEKMNSGCSCAWKRVLSKLYILDPSRALGHSSWKHSSLMFWAVSSLGCGQDKLIDKSEELFGDDEEENGMKKPKG